jgi:hypothetical protein
MIMDRSKFQAMVKKEYCIVQDKHGDGMVTVFLPKEYIGKNVTVVVWGQRIKSAPCEQPDLMENVDE